MEDNFLFAMNKSFEEMKKVIYNVISKPIYSEKDKQDLFYSVGSCLHYTLDYAERVNMNQDYNQIFSAFRHVNNSLKHSCQIKEISEHKGGITFPIEFELEIPIRKVVWSVSNNEGYEPQRRNYEILLKDKDVISTLQEFINILIGCTKK